MSGFLERLAAHSAAALVFAALGASSAFAGDDDPLIVGRQLFVLAYAAAETGAPLPSLEDPAELRGYPLYPYLERARLIRALGKIKGPGPLPVDDDARAFLAAHAGEPVAPDLRRAWLRSLAARAEWSTFAEQYSAAVADARLRCQWLQARIELGHTNNLEADVAEQWLTPQRLPPDCEQAFDWLRARNGLGDALVEQRVRLLLANGQTDFARTVARGLAPPRAAAYARWADMLDKPTASLDAALADAERATELDGAPLAAGWRKLARSNSSNALERYDRMLAVLGRDSPAAARYTLVLALGLAWDRRGTEALELFDAVPANMFDDYAREWQTRAALWAGDWGQVRRSIAAMSGDARGSARWRYWNARAAAALDDEAAANEIYEALLPTDNFYAANAAARLGRPAVPHPARLEQHPAEIEALGARPAFVRARELKLCGLRGPAFREWQAAFDALTEAERTQAVALAASWQWHDVSVAMATQQRVFFDYELLYPRPYDAEVAAAAGLASLDAPLLYGMIRQESLFRSDAVSAAGAVGLAQLLPATAVRTARAWQHPEPGTVDLFDPAMNIKLGAWHMRDLTDRFDRQTVVALAAYNAGESAAERWLPQDNMDADVWIENIPYNETREYVQRVLWHGIVFAWLESGAPQRVDGWIAEVAPLRPIRQASSDGG
ncbi:MAG TPA: transglycosylase SLT domain-containing protein [Gammaproteobacteria bacterium]|nr:transglycosylase SLT domain-containing protein [Gammaproteobacteria bacterium]